jgi:hypothetical protein
VTLSSGKSKVAPQAKKVLPWHLHSHLRNYLATEQLITQGSADASVKAQTVTAQALNCLVYVTTTQPLVKVATE